MTVRPSGGGRMNVGSGRTRINVGSGRTDVGGGRMTVRSVTTGGGDDLRR
ncbi:hypothetical protein ABZV31_03590 [Streptomyces sp. NPDC005202]